ncbi:hypothetical protein [Photobacterium sp. 1_MG-2023]|uniref:hypothetical protein n=1 Tax=Photobacterium sp. 1_MG-2023 TaxID=3062646 RepID=UPI0026E1F090|nr:hypothetical protein [Photobacterium sp. 1_MG-2023]MDO6708804.1 hypothetical protein [Photobacterium sp. 1_MG-2023]
MCKIKIIRLLITTLISMISAESYCGPIAHPMTVTTQIDKNKFFGGEINVTFTENNLIPKFNKDSYSLKDIHTQLAISTNIPNDDSSRLIQHTITLTKNDSYCYRFNDVGNLVLIDEVEASYPYQSEMVNIFIDSYELDMNTPRTLPFNDMGKDYLQADYKFTLKFNRLPLNVNKCEGEIQVMVEFDL